MKLNHTFIAALLMCSLIPFLAIAQVSTQAIYQQNSNILADYAIPEHVSTTGDSLLAGYITEALEQSNALKSAFESWVAASQTSDQMGSLPDPEVMFQYYLNPVKYEGVISQATIGVMQMFPWFGTRAEGRRYASHLADARLQNVEKVRLQLENDVKSVWFQLVLNHRSEAYLNEHLDWVQGLVRLTRTRLESGYASRADILRLELEREAIQSQIKILKTERNGLETAFNALLSREPQEISLPDGRPESSWEVEYLRTLEVARGVSPDLLELEHLSLASEAMQKRAKLESYPMIGVGLEVMGSNYIMGMNSDRVPIVAQFRVTLPIWRARYKASIKQAEAEARVVQYNKADVNQRLQSETGILFANYNEADERVKLYKERLIPRSRELTDLMLLDYSSGRIRLDDVITARRQSVEYAISLEKAVFDRNMIVAQFEKLVALETQEK